MLFVLRLQLYDFVEHKVQGDGNCQVCLSLSLSILATFHKDVSVCYCICCCALMVTDFQ